MNTAILSQLPANTNIIVGGALTACAFALAYYMVRRLARQAHRSTRSLPPNPTVDDFVAQGYDNTWLLLFHALIVTSVIWLALQSLLNWPV